MTDGRDTMEPMTFQALLATTVPVQAFPTLRFERSDVEADRVLAERLDFYGKSIAVDFCRPDSSD